MCVNNLPRVALDNGEAGIRTRDLLIANPAPYHYANEPHCIVDVVVVKLIDISTASFVCLFIHSFMYELNYLPT